MNLLISNLYNYHYEILESLVILFPKLINKNFNKIKLLINKNDSFEKYFSNKYPNIIISNQNNNEKYDYVLYATSYLKDIRDFQSNIYYVSHEVLDYYDLSNNKNIITLTPLCKKSLLLKPFILPYQNEKIKSEIPIFVIQGNFDDENYNHSRRNYDLIEDILIEDYKFDFQIKLLGRGKIPSYLENHPKISFFKNLNFEDYHKEFLNAYAIIPCISKETHPQYYLNKYTSSISYGEGYNLYFLIDEELDQIYNPNKKVIYQNNISEGFNKLLEMFYEKENNK